MAVSQVKLVAFDSNEDSEYSDEDKRPPIEQRSRKRKQKAPQPTKTRIDIISQPPDRAFINLYADFRNVLEPKRAERIRRKLETFKKMTLEQLEQVLEERKQHEIAKAKAKKWQKPQHFGSYCELKLDELYEQVAELIKDRIKQNPRPEQQAISPTFKNLLDFAAYNIYPTGDIHKRVAFEVATFVEHVLQQVDK